MIQGKKCVEYVRRIEFNNLTHHFNITRKISIGKKVIGKSKNDHYSGDKAWRLNPGMTHIGVIKIPNEAVNSRKKLHIEIDATIIGPYDLSASVGHPGEFNRLEVKRALKKYERTSRKYKKPTGYHVVHPERHLLSQKIKRDYKFIAYGIDEIFLSASSNKACETIVDLINPNRK